MKVAENKVVQMHYTLKNDNDEVLDTSEGREPLAYIQGIGQIIPGLEKQMEGKAAGDKVVTTIAAADAYGEVNPNLVQKVSKQGFQGEEELVVGMQVEVNTNNGPAIAMVTDIEGEDVTLDLNHPLAGMTLHFDVDVVEVREATEEELSHGHVHGPGGHQH